MLKYLSYFNLVFAIIFFVILKSNKSYIDLCFIAPQILFNWLTLFHLIKNNLRFDKWHLYLGYLSIFTSIVSTIITFMILLEIFSNKSIVLGSMSFLILMRPILDFSVIYQFIVAQKANMKLLKHSA